MTPRRRRLLLGVLLVATWAIAVVSCGNGQVSKEEYGTQVRGVMADLESAYGDAGAAVAPSAADTASSTEQTIEDLRASQLALRDAGNRLSSIEPPEELADEHDALVAGVRDMADAVDLLIDAQRLAESDPAEAKRLARSFATDSSFGAVEAAASKIESAGVDAGL